MKKDNKSRIDEAPISSDVKELVILRIETTPSNLRLSMGGEKSMTKEEMIEHVRNEDEIGKKIIRTHLIFLKAIANGEITNALASI